MRITRFGWIILLSLPSLALAREARLVRYPHYHNGRVAFSYIGDIWTADESGKNIQRITAHKARDVFPRFSPDGKWIAFSSDRNGNLDVFIIPAEGGTVKALTTHSADDTVLGWSPDSKLVLFASQRGEGFMGKLYTVSIDGGMPRDAGPDMGVYGSFSPDGLKLAVNRKSQTYWRKYYRGAYQSDVTVMDLSAKTFKELTNFNGMDSWPMWSSDGSVYFVSDRDGKGVTNIWRVPETGGDAERVTSFHDGDVRWPAVSGDGKTIVFERDFGLWKLDLPAREARPIKLEIAAETQENLTDYREFNSQADDFAPAPNGRRIVFSTHGEIFTAPTEEGDLVQITDGPARDQDVEYSPDGKWITYVSDKSGREEIYAVASDGSGETKKLTDIDALKTSYAWSPDSKEVAFTTSDGKLMKCSADGQETKELASSKYGPLNRPSWSPDGKWIAIAKPDVSRTSDIYLIPTAGGEEKKVSFDSNNETNPRFSADAKKLYFVRVEGTDNATGRPDAQIYVVYLEKQDRDPTEPASAGEGSDAAGDGTGRRPGGPRGGSGAAAQPVKPANIDWAGLKRRTRQVTRQASAVFNYLPGNDSRSLIFVSSDGSGTRGVPTLYSIQDDGKRLSSSSKATPSTP
jgi:tricorn protease